MTAPTPLDPDLDLSTPEARDHYQLLRNVAQAAWNHDLADTLDSARELHVAVVKLRKFEMRPGARVPRLAHPMTRGGR
jgi:hypothetical protein